MIKRISCLFIIVSVMFNCIPLINAQQLPTRASGPEVSNPSFRTKQIDQQNEVAQEALDQDMGYDITGGLRGFRSRDGLAMQTYQVHVLGEVGAPGTFRVGPSTRLAEAIEMSGGIQKIGSGRRIELRRQDGSTRIIDLQMFRRSGSLKNNPYLIENDVVYIPLKNKIVEVLGSVKRPAQYEITQEKDLLGVVKLAGGFNNAVARNDTIRLIRYTDGEKKVMEIPVNDEAMRHAKIESGDVVVVPNVMNQSTDFDYNIHAVPGSNTFYPSYEDRVFVLGGVNSSGAYPFSPFYTINQYVSLAGGISDRGSEKYWIVSIDGKKRKASSGSHVNPGETVMVKQGWMSPPGWIGFGMSMASFGLSVSTTVLALTR
jgi:protein involved in polysaccharide export with SLBB domain